MESGFEQCKDSVLSGCKGLITRKKISTVFDENLKKSEKFG